MARSFKDLSPRVIVCFDTQSFLKNPIRQTKSMINNTRVKFPLPALRKFSVLAKLATSF